MQILSSACQSIHELLLCAEREREERESPPLAAGEQFDDY